MVQQLAPWTCEPVVPGSNLFWVWIFVQRGVIHPSSQNIQVTHSCYQNYYVPGKVNSCDMVDHKKCNKISIKDHFFLLNFASKCDDTMYEYNWATY